MVENCTKHNEDISGLLYLLLLFTSFDKLRFYVFEPSKRIAVLQSAYTKDISGNIERVDTDNSAEYSPLKRIPINFNKLFQGGEYKKNDFLDFICHFRDKNIFSLELGQLNNTPLGTKKFHDQNNIKELVLAKITGTNNDFFGYLALDNSLKANQRPTEEELVRLEKIIKHITPSLIRAFEKCERDWQIEQIIKTISGLATNIEKGLNRHDLLEFLGAATFRICGAIDLLQIKAIEPKNRYQYAYIRFNSESSVSKNEKEIVENLAGEATKIKGFIKLVVEQKKSIIIPNTHDPANQEYRNIINSFKGMAEKNPKNAIALIVERNNSEVNVPLMIGNELYGVIDAHGSRPFALNINTLRVLEDLAPWFAFIISDNYKDGWFVKALKEAINRNAHREYENSQKIKENVYYSLYKNMLIKIRNKSLYKLYQTLLITIIGLSLLSIPAYFIGIKLIHPIISITAILTLPFINKMLKNAEREYEELLEKKLDFQIKKI